LIFSPNPQRRNEGRWTLNRNDRFSVLIIKLLVGNEPAKLELNIVGIEKTGSNRELSLIGRKKVKEAASRSESLIHLESMILLKRGDQKRSDTVKTYKHQALKELADQQVRFAPPPRRLEQLKRAELLLAELDPQKDYPYQFICYRVTDYRSESYPGLLMHGHEIIHDMGLWINELASSLPAIRVEEVAEPVLTLDEISKKLNVTTKTINRWRKRGLIGIPVVKSGRRQVGFLPSLVDPFQRQQGSCRKEREIHPAHSGRKRGYFASRSPIRPARTRHLDRGQPTYCPTTGTFARNCTLYH